MGGSRLRSIEIAGGGIASAREGVSAYCRPFVDVAGSEINGGGEEEWREACRERDKGRD